MFVLVLFFLIGKKNGRKSDNFLVVVMIKDVVVNFVLFSKVMMFLISVVRNEYLKWLIEELFILYFGFCL